MRELTVRIKFVEYCLGDVKEAGTGRYLLPRDPATGAVVFVSSWHRANMRFAADLFGRHQDEAPKINWAIQVDGVVSDRYRWYRRYYQRKAGRRSFVLHECFIPGQVVGFNCVVPATIPDDDLWSLLVLAGRYRGLSPWKPGQFGRYEVESIRVRRAGTHATDVDDGPAAE